MPFGIVVYVFMLLLDNLSRNSCIHLGGERHCESKVSRPRTQHNVPAGLELGALALEPSTLTKRPQCFRKKCNVLPIFYYKGSSIGGQIPGSPEIFFQKTSSQGRSQSKSQPEPGNIRDKNALKFEAFLGGEWYILGYCALAKKTKVEEGFAKRGNYKHNKF